MSNGSALLTRTTGRRVFHFLVAVVARVVAAGVAWPEDPPQNRWAALPTNGLRGRGMLKSAPPRTDHTPGPLHPASALGAQGRRFRLLRMPGLTLIALVGVLALWLAVAVPATGTVSAQAMDDATLSSLTLSDVTLTPAFDSATTIYTATVASTVAETTVTATSTNPTPPWSSRFDRVVDSDGIVPLIFGDNDIDVVVTAEDGMTTKVTYRITVTRARYIATRSFNPSTVAPGGTVAVTITYGDYGTLGGQTLETLPAGFSWIFVSIDDLHDQITAVLDPNNNQILDIIMLGAVDSFTYEVTVADTVLPGVHLFSGTIRDDDRDIHDIWVKPR